MNFDLPDTDATFAPLGYREAVLADAPVRYYRLGDPGEAVHDESGHADAAFAGTCAPTAGALTGDGNRATRFAQQCTFSVGTALRFEGRTPFTIELWIDSIQVSTQYTVMNEQRNATRTRPIHGYAIVIDAGGIYGERAIDGDISGTPRVDLPSRFTHVVHTFDGSAHRLFVDAVGTTPSADTRDMPSYTAELQIGGLPEVPVASAQGAIDEVAIYDHALTEERITLHHDIGVNGPR